MTRERERDPRHRWNRKIEPVGAAAESSARAERWAREAGTERQWSWPEQRRLIGRRIQRLDGPAKATGTARYAYDMNLPRMAYGRMIRSPHARARLLRLDLSAAEAAPGVRRFRAGALRS